jgi:hypothetical protein
MSETRDALAASNERTLKLIATVHQNMLDATQSYISAISGRPPDDVTWTPPSEAEQPDPKELIEETFKFQTAMLEANKSFTLSLAELWGQLEPPAAKK